MPALTNRQEVYVTYLASAALQPQRGLAPDERRTTCGRATGSRVIGCAGMWAAKAEAKVRGAGVSRGNCAALELETALRLRKQGLVKLVTIRHVTH